MPQILAHAGCEGAQEPVVTVPHECDLLRNAGVSAGRGRKALPAGPLAHDAVQVYEDELFITQPSALSVVNISENAAPPARVSSRNVPRRESLGVP